MKHIEVVFSSDIICFQILVQQQELLVPCHLLCALEMGTLLFQLEAELWSAQSPLLLTTTVLWLVHIYCEALFLSISFSFLSCLFGDFWFGFFFLLSNGKCPQLLHLWWRDCVFFSPRRAASSSEPPLSWAFCGNTTASYLHIACLVGVSLELRNHLCNSKPKQQALWATFLTWHVAKRLILPSFHTPYAPVWLPALFLLFLRLPASISAEDAQPTPSHSWSISKGHGFDDFQVAWAPASVSSSFSLIICNVVLSHSLAASTLTHFSAWS